MNRKSYAQVPLLLIILAGSQFASQKSPTADKASLAACLLMNDHFTRHFLGLARKTEFVSFISVDHGVPRTSNEKEPITSFLFLSPKR